MNWICSPAARRRAARAGVVLVWILVVFAGQARPSHGEDASVVEARLGKSARYLSSDELEGRGVGTKGLDLAASYVAEQFREAGLKTDLFNGSPFQVFKMSLGAHLGPANQLSLVGPAVAGANAADQQPQRLELKLADEFTPLALGGSGKFDLPLVFVGYGITAKAQQYDDYDGIDVKDKAVIILRHEPQQDNPHSAFDGTEPSQHAAYKRKVSNAYEHGAAAVIFCTDEFEIQRNLAQLRTRWQTAVDRLAESNARFKTITQPTADEQSQHEQEIGRLIDDADRLAKRLAGARDPLLAFDGAGPDEDGRSFPVLFCRRTALNPIVQQALGTSLAQLETEIDKGPAPRSRELAGWRIVGETSVVREQVDVKNVVGVLEGDGPHANETIVLGAHYDHLGYGGPGSTAPPGTHEIHNGADDNGSGTTVLIELARRLKAKGQKPPRRLVFIAFTGEERGLIGSARYVREPLFPLESTVAMLNLDMVGRLDQEKLIIHGTGTADGFDALADRYASRFGFSLTKDPSGFGPSDHSSFYASKVPVLFFFTGNHKDYHRPSDDFEFLNISGMRRIADMVEEIALELAVADTRPQYREAHATSGTPVRTGDRPYFGSIPDFSQEQPGLLLSGVTKDGPADRGGLKKGDIIIQLGDSKIGNLEDFDSALRKHTAGERIAVVVLRDKQQVSLEVTLDDPR